MDFNHTEERRMLADSLRRTLARGADWAALAELGVLGALFTESEGGFGGTGFDLAVVFEELGRAGSVEPVLEAGLAGGLLADAGRADLVERIIAGDLKVTLGWQEPGLRYDLGPLSTRAEGGRLTGRKSFVTNAEGAGLILVTALHNGAPHLFALAPDAPGVTLHTTPALMGGTISELTLTAAPADLIGPADLDARLAAATLAVCADTLGVMETVKAMTLDYLRTRTQFGRAIGSFQALQHKAADMLVAIEQSRSMAYFATMAAQGSDAAERRRNMHAVKAQIGRSQRLVGQQSIQLHGGIAMTMEYAAGHYFKRLTVNEAMFGDTDHHLRALADAGGLVQAA